MSSRDNSDSTSKDTALMMLKCPVAVPGRDVNIKRHIGLAPLHIAGNSFCLDAVTILVEAGEEVTVRDDKGGRPNMYSMTLCVRITKILKYLLSCKKRRVDAFDIW